MTSAPLQTVLVAVALDENAPALIHMGATLCCRAGMRLKVVHAVGPTPAFHEGGAEGAALLGPELIRTIQTGALDGAAQRVRELVRIAGAEAVAEVVVVGGFALDAIVEQAKAATVGLIIIGAGRRSQRVLLRGFSATISLLQDSPVPILVLPPGASIDFGKTSLRLLIADDLRDDTARAIERSLAWAVSIHATEVLQLHVSGMTEQTFIERIEGAWRKTGSLGEMRPHELWFLVRQTLVERIEARAYDERRRLIDSGARCTVLSETGPIVGTIETHVNSFQPDLVLFGHHERSHGRHIARGQVPFHVMLGLERPIMSVPSPQPEVRKGRNRRLRFVRNDAPFEGHINA